MRRLNGRDAVLLYSETPNVHKHTSKIGIIDSTNFDGDFTFEFFREDFNQRSVGRKPCRTS